MMLRGIRQSKWELRMVEIVHTIDHREALWIGRYQRPLAEDIAFRTLLAQKATVIAKNNFRGLEKRVLHQARRPNDHLKLGILHHASLMDH